MDERTRRIIHGWAFVCVGGALLATSPQHHEPAPRVVYSGAFAFPDVEIGNEQPRALIILRMDATGTDLQEVDEARAVLSMSVRHSNSSPQSQADNTPWISASASEGVGTESSGLGGELPAEQPVEARSGVFLREATLAIPIQLRGSCGGDDITVGDCQAVATIQLERALTADEELTSVVSGRLEVEVEVQASKNGEEPLPWRVTFEEGTP